MASGHLNTVRVIVRAMKQVTFQELLEIAQKGDSDAQYALAGAFASAGKTEEAEKWLKTAALTGNPDALYTLATRRMNTEPEIDSAMDDLRKAAEKGSTAAQRLVGAFHAEGLSAHRDWAVAVDHVIAAAKAGDAPAMSELAMVLLAHDPEDHDGAALLELGSQADPVAGAVYARMAGEGRKNTDAGIANFAMQRLEAARYPHTAYLREKLPQEEAKAPTEESIPNWERAEDILKTEPEVREIAGETFCETPSATVYRGAFTAEECEYLIAYGAERLQPSEIVDPLTGQRRPDDVRTSLTAVLGPVDYDLVTAMFNRRLAALVSEPKNHGEFLGVLNYSQGQEYRPHSDWLPPGKELERSGQRVATTLIYLNDDYEGGETHFLEPDVKFKGAPGDVLAFRNVTAKGDPDNESRHAGLPVTSGAKWLGSKWFREKRYAF